MTNLIKGSAAFVLALTAVLLSSQAEAQIQLNLTGNYLAPAEKGSSFSQGLYGGGATVRYFLNSNFAVGLNGRYLTRSESQTGSGVTLKVSANIIMATAQAEYFFTETSLRPYLGVEGGLYRTTAKANASGGGQSISIGSISQNNAGVAPKVGLQYALNPNLGVNLDAGYHIIFSEGETSKFVLLGLGVFFTLGNP